MNVLVAEMLDAGINRRPGSRTRRYRRTGPGRAAGDDAGDEAAA
ncbi:MAG: hypothetical protein U0800_26130 [Isosphaeraceae bacterium]